jgi:hypothetical protein
VNERATIHVLYKKLLNLYPRGFRERLGESMQQTFTDLYKERRTGSAWFGFVLWTFAETGIGIFREYVLLIAEGATVKTMLANPRSAPLISFILCVLPFMILEWATRSDAPRSDASPSYGSFVAPVDGIHCRPHADRANPSASGNRILAILFLCC